MNSINPDENTRPFGFWLKAVDRLMAAEFATAFESEGITRRDWRALNAVDGDARPLPTHKLRRLIERGWVSDADGTFALTDAGRDAKNRLGSVVEGIRAKVTDAVPADDLETTMKTLEQVARAFGWDEETPLPRGGGRRRFRKGSGRGHGRAHGFGAGHGHGHGFGHGHDFVPGHTFGPRSDCDRGHQNAHGRCGHGQPHGDHGRGGRLRAHVAHFAQDAYERGFDAGFTRARNDH